MAPIEVDDRRVRSRTRQGSEKATEESTSPHVSLTRHLAFSSAGPPEEASPALRAPAPHGAVRVRRVPRSAAAGRLRSQTVA